MAKVFGAVLGKNRGKIGQVNYWVVKGTQFNRAMPTVAKRRPTSAQADQQIRFASLGKLATAFMQASALGLKHKMEKAYDNAVSVFVKINQSAVSATGGEAEVDYGSLTCSLGNMPVVPFGNASFTEPARITVTWQTTAEPGTDAEDKVYVFIYSPDVNQGIISAGTLRSTGTITINTPSTWTGLTAHVYGFAVGGGRDNEGKTCDSSYIGTGNIG